MALPAGRYGVTKNQLLKIKKLPMNTIKLIEELTEKFDLLGTAAFKNSTSVVTQSTDLVESGAVKDIIGWGNKNLTDWKWNTFTTGNKLLITLNKGIYTISAQSTLPNGTTFIRGTKQDSSYCSKTELGVDNWTDSSTTGVYATTELLSSYTFSVPEDNVLIEFGRTNCNGTIPAQLEKGSTATTYEPYHASVEESKCDNSVIGTVEDGANPTKSYAVGEHMIRGGKFCTVTVAVTTSSTWTLGSNYVEGDVAEMLAPHKLLPNNANLNNYITEGEYFAGAGTYSNCPISDTAFRFKVMPFNVEASRCIQIIYANKTEPEIYMRTNFGGTWQSWYKFTGTVVS